MLAALCVSIAPAHAQQDATSGATKPAAKPVDARAPIITDEEFRKSIPSLDDKPMESIEAWQKEQEKAEQKSAEQDAKDPAIPAFQDRDPNEILPDPPVTDPLLEEPLPSIETFDSEPPPAPTETDDSATRRVNYTFQLVGLDPPPGTTDDLSAAYGEVRSRFYDLATLDKNGSAENGATVAARLREDRQLLSDILSGQGFFDANVDVQAVPPGKAGEPVAITLTVTPGTLYKLGLMRFDAAPTVPADLIEKNFVPKSGEPIVADRILSAEANIAIVLPENGYPFAKVGERDILLDEDTGLGDYTLPVSTGNRSYFGSIRTNGKGVFKPDHIEILRRFKKGDLYDSRKLDDLRAALVATGLLSTVSVEPVASADVAPDGTPYADLLVTQEKGPPRTISATAGYSTGQGFRAEASWTHRNLFPPEGALSLAAVLGTQEQSAGVAFTRSNAGKRDRTFEVGLSALHSNYDAFEAFTGKLYARVSRASTPIWQKKFTYAYGVELVGTNEQDYNFTKAARDRKTYYVAALPLQVGFDTSDNLLNPTKGYRVNVSVSPETSLGSGAQFYARSVVEGIGYMPFGDSLVFAARARVGSIAGVERSNIVPSRRFYGGGGGSVRGFGYQQLGPKDPNNDPIGGRSFVETAAEARYRFGNFGVVGFVDAGQVYEQTLPQFNDWRFGVGIGGRFYTNFGPIRLDVATPINRQPGESRISVYVSIGQAF